MEQAELLRSLFFAFFRGRYRAIIVRFDFCLRDGASSTSVQEYYGGTISWITPADLSNFNEIYISSGERNITQLGLEQSSAKLLPKDTVLLTTRTPIGYFVIAENDLCTNQGFKSFIPSKYYIPKYLFWNLTGNTDTLK